MFVFVLSDLLTGKEYYTGDRERAERAAADTGLFLDVVEMQPAEALQIIDSAIIEPLAVQADRI